MKIRMHSMKPLSLALALGLSACAGEPEDMDAFEDLGEAELAAGAPSAKAATAISKVTACGSGGTQCLTGAQVPTGVWQDVMSSTIKTSSVQDLFVDVSLVTGLYTSTLVKGNGSGEQSTAMAMGGVKVRVLLDGQPAATYPDRGEGITFDQRIQTLTAKLGNIFTDCFAQGGNTGTGCTLDPEQVSLALETTSAQSYGFFLLDVGPGDHKVTVQAMVNARATGSNGGVGISNAIYGMGTMTVEAVNMVNGFTL
ncbi:hypothetical protein [Polyangium aurulentum]|uniref:hypothetical protein n=1 Tax=Polyangium aurulentum TaxID=2567896 RepID=UPI0010ADB7E4|nr:hypothetical protein [Polyangium aurulentum]UQA54793.1 hypothetical protein E8A73_025840 [Polyangium aurulentum]